MDLSTFSVEKALKLTSHSKTSRDALKMSKPTFWKQLGRSDKIIWGNFKGKTIQRYACRVAIKKRFYFHCNCSSRQSPCRHALALLILLLEKTDSFKLAKPSVEFINWWDSLSEAPQESKKKSPGASKAMPKRLAKMKTGVTEVEAWIGDILRQGLGQLSAENNLPFQTIRQRMTDAGLGGLRIYIDEMELLIENDPQWPLHIHQPLAQLQALVTGLDQFDELKPIWQKEILNQCGVYTRRDELEELPVIEDSWAILWTEIEERSDGGFQRKVWMIGQATARFALLLEYNFREPKFMDLPDRGRWFKGALTYYPGPVPLRVLLRWKSAAVMPVQELPALPTFRELQKQMKATLQQNPWQRRIPVLLSEIKLSYNAGQISAIDKSGHLLPVQTMESVKWKMLAMNLDYPAGFTLFAEYNGQQVFPLGVLANEQYFSLAEQIEISSAS